ncbi:MAG: 30S ribosome-binding factor RbfA [Pirellulales bacterium]
MTSRRLLKAAQAIREVVSMAILTELHDPRVKYVTVTKVEVLPDMKQAKVYVTMMGDEKQQTLTLRGLQNAAGFLQSQHRGSDRNSLHAPVGILDRRRGQERPADRPHPPSRAADRRRA